MALNPIDVKNGAAQIQSVLPISDIGQCAQIWVLLQIANNPAVFNVVAGGGTTGTGSPEGVVTAIPGSSYLDTAAANFYVKASGVSNTGWLLIA